MGNQTNHVIDTIIARIDQGTYLPGALLDETSLANELNVSRTPVREAFIRLESEGLIIRGGRRGAQLFKPNTDEFLQILEVHSQLEAQAACLAARRITDDIAAALNRNLAASRQHLEQHGDSDHAGYYQLNLQFHGLVIDAAANPYLAKLIKTNARKLMAYYRNRYGFKGTTEKSINEHQVISDLIQAGNCQQAHAAMARHFEYDLAMVMDLLAAVT